MPSRERVEAFIAAVVAGDHAKVIADFYHEDASMQENTAPPRQGRAFLIAHEEKALRRLQSMETKAAPAFLVDGDLVVVQWTFIATGLDGRKRRLEELTLQRWRGERIAEERFYYDTATAWKTVSD